MIHGMARLYMLCFVLEVLLLVLALISCLSAEKGEVRTLPRAVWVILIVLIPLVGSLLYFGLGRPVPANPRARIWPPVAGFPEPARPAKAPDDDPDFLRSLDVPTRRSDAELLRQWEEDLKSDGNDLRKREDTPPTDG